MGTTTTRTVDLSAVDGAPHANLFPGSEPKTIRLTLAAGDRVDPHRHPGRQVVLYLLEGAVDLTVGDETHSLREGDVARFDGDQDISPHATERSTALVVLAPAAEGG
ncbi:cupin domain-containing protein [Candidatus Halobonum tyrrellensis]|uniref:Cupin n=1 Tax=Candidatus Halobonum tyrrellensis G22 TaxID=1324957 RepID=V4HJB4_9EURY|nr:cupin domain-containing protein [Candidatus Halobonum tyrrellensis]ESP89843.1 cupin [Candidatus Halobonum tyrrellensis G22]